MKKFLKVFLIVIALLLAIIVILPFAFKGKIVAAVKKAANENVNANVEFKDVNLSLIRNFPNLSVRLDSLSVVGVERFDGDTLVSVPKFHVTVNLMSLFRGSNYEVRSVAVDDARVFLKVLADGKANWDIMKVDSTATADTVVEPSEFNVSLKRLSLNNAFVIYDDASINAYVKAENINHTLKGDFSQDITDLDITLSIDRLLLSYDGVRYLNRVKTNFNSTINANLAKELYTFSDARLLLNELELQADGSFAIIDEDYDMDITFKAVRNEFKNFISLIPAIYTKDFENLKTTGTLAFNGFVKGRYTENTLPSFSLDISIADGSLRYPDLPGNVENINVKTLISNKTGDPDATIIDVDRFHLEMMGNPIDATLHLSTPVSDPYVDAVVNGRINLSDISKVYPLDQGESMSGLLIADFAFKGKQSDAENQRFNAIQAKGQLNLSNINYVSTDYPKGIQITRAQFDLSPAEISMADFILTIGQNDLSAKGKLSNYLAYTFDKGDLRGVMDMRSGYINLNDFMSNDTANTADTTASDLLVIEVPANIDFKVNSQFNRVIYDKLELTNVTGSLQVKDKQVLIQNLKFNTMEGQMTLNGSYSTQQGQDPAFDMAMNLQNIQVKKAFENFVTVEKLVPIAKQTEGRISSTLKISTKLGQDMMPLPATLFGEGNLTSQSLVINNISTFNRLADALKLEQFKQWALEKVNLSFKIEEGKVFVKPFNTKIGNINTEISGWNSFDQLLEYTLNLSIPRSTFGGAANNVLNNLVQQANNQGANFSVGETIPVAVLITGTVSDPKITTSLKDVKTNLKESIKETIQQKVDEVVGNVKEEASKYIEEANLQAKKILDEAQLKANQVIATGEQSAKKIRDEANKQADQLIAEGKKKGMVGELAAKKGADKVRSEGDNKANAVTAEAQKQADAIMASARQQADKIINDAKSRTK